MNVYIINGAPGSGKTTFENYCFALNPVYVRIYSSIDGVKKIAQQCGWDGVKEPKDRKFLSDLKQLLIDYNDYPLKDVADYIRLQCTWMDHRDYNSDQLIFFIDVREPKEIKKFCEAFGAQSILIARDSAKGLDNNADKKENFDPNLYDIIITNNGTLEQLEAQAREFMKDKKYK